MKIIAKNTITRFILLRKKLKPTMSGRGFQRSLLAGLMLGLLFIGTAAADSQQLERGEYLTYAGGCISCHTADNDDAIPLAGGHKLETPFGIFHVPNITPDKETGIGNWSDDDFINAMHEGISPDGKNYFPAFPYASYTGTNEDDVLAIKAYLFSLEPVYQPNEPHELAWYVSRLSVSFWKMLYFSAARFEPDTTRPEQWNRGAYLVRHLGHCGECHTPRNRLGGPDKSRALAGSAKGVEGESVPNITQDKETGIGRWSADDIETFLDFGMLPDGDFTGSDMSAVIDDNTSHLTPEDRQAIAAYLLALPHKQAD